MAWFSKKIQAPAIPVAQQASFALKSLSLPAANPHWRLFSQFPKNWNNRIAIDEGYNASAIVYACVEKRAKLIASVPWKVMTIKAGEWVEAENHPLARLMENPNPDMSGYELMYAASQSLDLSGNAFISEIKAGIRSEPRELWILPSEYMKLKPGRERLVDYFEYTEGSAASKRIESADMIQLKLPNPGDRFFGMPVLMAAGRATDIDRESGIWQKVSLENRGASDINIKLPDNATEEQVNNIQKQYTASQAGAKNARKALITNADIQQLGQSAVELDFVNSRRAVWTEICACFGMSLANLGMTEAVNLANAEAMEKSLWQDTIVPQLELIKRQLNHQLAVEFGTDVRLAYDTTNVKALQESEDKKLDKATKLFAMGVPFDVINQRYELGVDEFEGSDIGYLSAGLIPVGQEIEDLPELEEEEKRLVKELAYGPDNGDK